ncbi:MAG: hypothetical protein ACXVAY_18730 [Mucilaginibacter sp.]
MNKLLTIFGLLLILQSCTEEKAGWWKNDQIKASKREDLHELKARIIQDIKDNNMKHLEYVMSKELIEDNINTQRQVDHIGNYLNTNDYTVSDEYYVVNKWKESDTIKTNKYNLIYGGVAREMYFAFLLPKKGVNQWMITLVFGKFDYGWRLSTLDVEPYKVNSKTGPELYKLAQQEYEKHYYSNAATNMQLASICLRPNDFWQYPGDSVIYNFQRVALAEANNHLTIPCVINQVSTHPRIFRIANEKTQYGTFPMIYYQTSVNLKDINGLKKEQQAMKKVIGKIIPGIDKDNDYLFYTAFNKMPNNRESVDRYEIDDKLK